MTYQEANEIVAKAFTLPENVQIHLRRSLGREDNDLTAMDRIQLNSIIPETASRLDRAKCAFCVGLACLYKGKDQIPLPEAVGEQGKKEMNNDLETVLKKAARVIDSHSKDWDEFRASLWALIKYLDAKGYCVAAGPLLFDLLAWDARDKFVQDRWERTIARVMYTKKNEIIIDD